jgi:hypothetical protein
MGIDTQEKINFLNNRITNLQVHIDILSDNVAEYPNTDAEGKPTRQSVLDDILNEKEVLLSQVQALNNQS